MAMLKLPPVIRALVPSKRLIGVFQGIAASTAAKQTVTLQISAAWNFVDLYLILVNLTSANFQELRLKIGGNIIQRWAGADLDRRLQYDKQPASSTNAILKLPMRRMGIRGGMSYMAEKQIITGAPRDLAYESTLNCGSAGGGYSAIVDVQLELDVINTGGPQPSVSLYGSVTSPVPGGPGGVYRVDKQTKTLPAAGTVTITKSEMGVDALRPLLNRITLVNPDSGNITFDNFLLRYGNNDWWQVSAAFLQQICTEDGLRTSQQPDQYILDFQAEGWGDTPLDLSDANADILLQFEVAGGAGGENLVYYIESVGLPFSPNA